MYEKSIDGEWRSPVVLRIRLTRAEHRKLRAMAKANGTTPKEICEHVARLAIEDEMWNQYCYPLKEAE